MGFYAYKGRAPLGTERPGSEDKLLRKDITSQRYFLRQCRTLWGRDFRAYTFANFYDDKSFREIS